MYNDVQVIIFNSIFMIYNSVVKVSPRQQLNQHLGILNSIGLYSSHRGDQKRGPNGNGSRHHLVLTNLQHVQTQSTFWYRQIILSEPACFYYNRNLFCPIVKIYNGEECLESELSKCHRERKREMRVKREREAAWERSAPERQRRSLRERGDWREMLSQRERLRMREREML